MVYLSQTLRTPQPAQLKKLMSHEFTEKRKGYFGHEPQGILVSPIFEGRRH